VQNPGSLGSRVLAADPIILRVLVLDKMGNELAHVYSEAYPPKARLGKETEEAYGRIDTLFMEAFSQAEKSNGKMNFILIAYETTKVMLMPSRKNDVFLAVRIPRSANVEYLSNKVKQIIA
jgi:hypothetical protein